MGEICFDPCSASWPMGVQSSPEPVRSFNKVSNMTNNVKSTTLRTKPWSNSWTTTYDEDETESRARTFECGDILISRDVLYDDYRTRNECDSILQKSGHVSRPEKTVVREAPVPEKKENVSLSSELPVAKSKWGVALRHVVTRDSSTNDPSTEARQPLYNFRQLPKVQLRSSSEPPSSREGIEGRSRTGTSRTNRSSRSLAKSRPRSMCELPRTPTKDVQIAWHSTSADDIDAHCSKQNKELSIYNKLRDIETTQPSHMSVRRRDTEIRKNDTTSMKKHLSLEDLLRLDQESLSVDVVERHIDKPEESKVRLMHKEIEKRPRSSANTKTKSFSLPPPQKPFKVEQCQDSSSSSSTGSRSIGTLTAEKLSIFGKQTSSHTKRARSLEELLKLDEDNLSVDVISKTNSCNDMKNSLKLSSHEDVDSLSSFKTDKSVSERTVPTSGDNMKSTEIGQIILSQDMINKYDVDKQPSVRLTEKTRTISQDSQGTLEYLTKDLTRSNCGRKTQLNGMYPMSSNMDAEGKYRTMCKASEVHRQNGLTSEMNENAENQNKLRSENERPERNVVNEKTYDVNKIDVYFEGMESCSEEQNDLKKKTQTNPAFSSSNVISSGRVQASPGIDRPEKDKCKNPTTTKHKTLNTTGTAVKTQKTVPKRMTNGNVTTADVSPSRANSGKNADKVHSTTVPDIDRSQKKAPKKVESPAPVLPSQEPVSDRKTPINRKVGKLIIMTGDERDKQLKLKRLNKGQKTTTSNGPSNLEDLRRSHKEGLLLTFMSNELEDDGVIDNFPVPRIVFNQAAVKLKSMLHTVRHSIPKSTHFSTLNLVTVHSYPSEESLSCLPTDEPVKVEPTKIPEAAAEKFPNIKQYEPTYTIDFGSVIQRERDRLNTMEKLVTVPRSEQAEAVGYSDEEPEHFNSHQHQDTGQALLF